MITETIKDCYTVLGAIHTKVEADAWAIQGLYCDAQGKLVSKYSPTVIGPMGKPLEVQIRTEEMHHVAEYGVAAHWAYKEGQTSKVEYDKTGKKLDIFREILELQDGNQRCCRFYGKCQRRYLHGSGLRFHA